MSRHSRNTLPSRSHRMLCSRIKSQKETKTCPPKKRAASTNSNTVTGFVAAVPSHALWDGTGIFAFRYSDQVDYSAGNTLAVVVPLTQKRPFALISLRAGPTAHWDGFLNVWLKLQ